MEMGNKRKQGKKARENEVYETAGSIGFTKYNERWNKKKCYCARKVREKTDKVSDRNGLKVKESKEVKGKGGRRGVLPGKCGTSLVQ